MLIQFLGKDVRSCEKCDRLQFPATKSSWSVALNGVISQVKHD
ncbi:hypothetical protein HMPREF0454_04699 [Hafnia alvei ATCC 51873]|uniref:Uncharacterized protein n=1 Tax=Hafnia alvei ATCC 51873 TaxID=1002364 RepID=G9YDJ6_HAFAL|nr:hypothetical protein HMPREF0454_04699 [Hafnia alvei ATCC 51873]